MLVQQSVISVFFFFLEINLEKDHIEETKPALLQLILFLFHPYMLRKSLRKETSTHLAFHWLDLEHFSAPQIFLLKLFMKIVFVTCKKYRNGYGFMKGE